MKLLAVLPAAVVLSACGATHYCMVDQDYQKAAVVPELQPVDGLSLPESAGALHLPPPPAKGVAFGQKGADGQNVCLDQPPKMTSVPPKVKGKEVIISAPKPAETDQIAPVPEPSAPAPVTPDAPVQPGTPAPTAP